jgi:hypothetical protein
MHVVFAGSFEIAHIILFNVPLLSVTVKDILETALTVTIPISVPV